MLVICCVIFTFDILDANEIIFTSKHNIYSSMGLKRKSIKHSVCIINGVKGICMLEETLNNNDKYGIRKYVIKTRLRIEIISINLCLTSLSNNCKKKTKCMILSIRA